MFKIEDKVREWKRNLFHLGALCAPNKEAFRKPAKIALFFRCKIDQTSKFFRKSFRCVKNIFDNANEC